MINILRITAYNYAKCGNKYAERREGKIKLLYANYPNPVNIILPVTR